MIQIVGDRPEDLLAALEYMASEGMAMIVTSGGLGPTADDLTAEVVGRFCGREMRLDPALEERICRDPRADAPPLAGPRPRRAQGVQPQAGRVPRGRDGARAGGHRSGPRRAAGRRGRRADHRRAARAATRAPADVADGGGHRGVRSARDRGATEYRNEIVRLFGIPESEIANTLREADAAGIPLEQLEITTCLRRGEIEIATRYEPPAQEVYDRFLAFVADRHADTLFSARRLDDRRAGGRAAARAGRRWPSPSRAPAG